MAIKLKSHIFGDSLALGSVSILHEVKSSEIISDYQKIGVDVSDYFSGIDKITLELDQKTDLMQWFPSIVGNGNFYAELSNCVEDYYPLDKDEYIKAQQLISASSSILEIGCGEGAFGQLCGPHRWYGVDINSQAIERAQSKGLKCQVWNIFSSESLVHAPDFNRFQIICSFQTLEHFADPGKFFEALKLFMSPGQKLLLAVPSHDSLLGMHPYTTLNLPPHHQSLWSDSALLKFPRLYGFELETLIHCNVDHIHTRWYVQEFLRSLIPSTLSTTTSLFGRIKRRIIAELIHGFVSKVVPVDQKIDPRLGARGQSVLALYSLS